MMYVRLAMPEEEDTFVELARLMLPENYPHLTFSEENTRETFRRYIASAHPTIFFAEQDGQVIGVAQATISAFDFADGIYTTLCGTYVRPDKRGTRAAALLLQEFSRWSDQLGAIESTGGNDNNLTTDRTIRLMGHFGWECVGAFLRRKAGVNGEKGR
ncbi:GNAT family N-acetyltransferase [Bradyrhizobium sp. 33ap4]|uniref:GNAT family N-acetyltransferase n=1 Tax=Bradyrhizobium sp. 33ap4 TaxID=3061630 RepID=UPI00292DA2C6|nr:GNAT family N-acetyltransferase [Bradyrhizobium sp. 33ap4]